MDPAAHEHGPSIEHRLARQAVSGMGEAAQRVRGRRVDSAKNRWVRKCIEWALAMDECAHRGLGQTITSPGKKINRYYDNFQNETERDKASNRPLIEETDVVEFFKRLGFQATVYQEKLLRYKSQFIHARWSRQSGKSLAMAVAVLFNALTRKGFRAAIVGPSKRQSLKMIEKISRLLSRLGRDVLEGPPRKGRLVF